MRTDGTTREILALVAPQIEKMGYELWGLQCHLGARRGRICIYIDHPQGITHADCANVSDQISGLLDVADLVRTAYHLEVSSPGLDRLLMCPEHFQRYQGASVSVRLRWPLQGRRRMEGRIGQADEQAVEIWEQDECFLTPYPAIAQARLHYQEE